MLCLGSFYCLIFKILNVKIKMWEKKFKQFLVFGRESQEGQEFKVRVIGFYSKLKGSLDCMGICLKRKNWFRG